MAAPFGQIRADFFYKYFRFSWRETYWFNARTGLQPALLAAERLAAARLPLFGNDGTIAGSPYLDRIIVSAEGVKGDTLQSTFFREKTLDYANSAFAGDKAADPEFCIDWETTANTGFARTRFLSAVPSSILGFTNPATHNVLVPTFQTFANALNTTWGYILTGSGPDASAEVPIAAIEFDATTFVRVWADPLPAQEDEVEIRYTRFLKGSPVVRGDFQVASVGDGFFRVDMGRDAPNVRYFHGGIWRFPTARYIPFDGSSFITGLSSHRRGYKAHARRARNPNRKPLIF